MMSLWLLFVRTTYHNEINNPIRRRPNRRTPRPHRRRIDLRRIQPRDPLEAEPEKRIIQKEERHCRFRHLRLTRRRISYLLRISNQNCEHEVAEALAGGAQHHHFPTTPALDEGDGERAEDEVGD